MKPGPAPTPTQILHNRDSWRAKTRVGEPKPEMGKPMCPRWLTGRPKKEWNRIAKLTDEMGVLAKTDGNALARYCQLWHRWLEAEEFLQLHGSTYPIYSKSMKDEKGKPLATGFQLFPQVKVASNLAQLLARLENEFGLTPAARTRVISTEAEEGENRGGPGKARYFDAAG